MGADQIGFLVKGPAPTPFKKIVEEKFSEAVAVVQKIVDEAKVLLVKSEESEDFEFPDDASTIIVKQYENDGEEAFEHFAALDARAIVQEFVEFWTTTDERDTYSRLDPDDELQRIVFAGQQSWGDSPDGEGYRILDQAFTLGICDVFGVR